MMIKISVALCTYNGEDYLKEQLQSILAQNRKVDEIVICDDCSSDSTILIVKQFIKNYPNLIRLHQNKTNIGYRRNFDNCYRLCKGEYIFSCDQDDIWCVDKVEKIMKAFDKDTVLVFSNASLIDKYGNDMKQSLWDNLEINYNSISNTIKFKDTIKQRFIVTGATMAFRKSMYEKIDIYDYDCEHDALLAYAAPIFGKVVAINEELTKYRRHGNNVTAIGPFNHDVQTKRTIMDKLKLNFSEIKGNGRYNRFSLPCDEIKSIYHISKDYDDDYSKSYNERFQYFNNIYKISIMNRIKSIYYLTLFVCKKDNRINYKKYKKDEFLPIVKDYFYLIFARDYK